jgi:hypothetical protein
MPEIKHNFTAGRMNKDLDERLVPNGQYRDALNIQVRTTDGDGDGVGNAGVVQNIQGNELVSSSHLVEGYDEEKSKVVGSIADEKSDNVYYFTAAPVPDGGIEGIPATDITSEKIWLDSITEFNANTNTSEPVLIDTFAITSTLILTQQSIQLPGTANNILRVADLTKYRVGMKVFFYSNPQQGPPQQLFFDTSGVPGLTIIALQQEEPDDPDINEGDIIFDSNTNVLNLPFYNSGNISDDSAIVFIHPERVLEFDRDRLINGINIIDKLLFWTDGENEPKKININRSKAGCVNNTVHTKLFVHNPVIDDFVAVVGADNSPESIIFIPSADIKKEHITVIRKKPLMAPEVHMKTSDRLLETSFELQNYSFVQDLNGDGLTQTPSANAVNPTVLQMSVSNWPNDIDYRINDTFVFKDITDPSNPVIIRANITNITSEFIELTMLFVDLDLTANNTTWQVSLEQQGKNLFESKFGRFAYRYKYEDNEYSAFSPWSELAFIPTAFAYNPSKGYNDGMLNRLKQLTIRNFIPHDSYRPSDVKEVDILWKTTDDANVYILKSIKREVDNEWEGFTGLIGETTGVLVITSEMINKALPSNQILRAWDNVPKKATAQEITSNRLVYGNYEQGYNITAPIGLKQVLKSTQISPVGIPKKSVKTLRQYRFGMVFGDKYGRETPVIANGYTTSLNETTTGDVTVGKELSHKKNTFHVQQNWEDIGATPLEWMDYVKYYVKETSNEYYNLTMDRWYDAKDNNVWLSFPSVDRNKIDEDSFLILKNEQGSQMPVSELARYKVIAIENEAPDFIKLSKYNFSKVPLGNWPNLGVNNIINLAYTANTSTAIPSELIGNTMIRVQRLDAEAVHNFAEGGKYVRIVATYDNSNTGTQVDETQLYSPWVEASEIIKNYTLGTGENAQDYTGYVTLKRPFTEAEVNMYNKMITLGYTEIAAGITEVDNYDSEFFLQYHIQFKNEKPVNRPEFDGRFFVKVEKDDILRTKVLLENNGSFVASGNYNLSYIDAKYLNPATNTAQSYDNFQWDEPAEFDSESELSDFALSTNNFNTLSYWNWFGEKTESSTSSPIYIDAITSRNNPQWYFYDPVTADTGGDNELEELIDSGGNGGLSSEVNSWLVNNCYGFGNPSNNNLDQADIRTFPGLGVMPGPFGINVNYSDTIYPNNGEFNLLSFSVNAAVGEPSAWAVAGLNTIVFRSLMQTADTYFRFTGDPNQNIYKVVTRVLPMLSNLDLDNYNANLNNQIFTNVFGQQQDTDFDEAMWAIPVGTNLLVAKRRNYDQYGDTDYKRRETILVPFVRVNSSTGVPIANSGIDISVWDPRGDVKQNGVGFFNIEIVNLETEDTLNEDTVLTNRAIWETEPKKEVDIDLYYEASNAIPMTLNTSNIYTFVQPNTDFTLASKFFIDRRELVNGSIETPTLFGIPSVFTIINSSPDMISVVNNDSGNDDLLLLTQGNIGVSIGDIVKFVNNGNTNTKSRILDHINIQTGQPSNRITTDGFGVQEGGFQGGNCIVGSFTSQIASGEIAVGMEVTGEFVERGTFVMSFISLAQNAQIIYLSRALLLDAIALTDFTFIEVTGGFRIDRDVWRYQVELGWHNCYSFGNGVESDRIRDSFNAPQIDNGCRVSATFLEYEKEEMGSGMIYSGLYNSVSGMNNLNEFNMAEKITKNLNPIYGSIQAMKTRDTDVVVFAEDKVLKVLSNKDAVFNADGNPQLTATNRVLGQAIPFAGDYGISRNPESLATDQYRMYFSDKQRGAILRLSADGLTPISNVGMRSYFREHLKLCDTIIGSYDIVNGEYNVTLNISQVNQTTNDMPITVSFNEGSKGWVSFKSFIPTSGVSVSGKYITSYDNSLYQHYSENENYNTFYGQSLVESEVEIIFNDLPGIVKSFKTINYEGTQARINAFATIEEDGVEYQDGEFYNLNAQNGWYVSNINTDLQEGQVSELIEKENKWFNKINGVANTIENIDMSELSVQGIGFPSIAPSPSQTLDGATLNITDTGDSD